MEPVRSVNAPYLFSKGRSECLPRYPVILYQMLAMRSETDNYVSSLLSGEIKSPEL